MPIHKILLFALLPFAPVLAVAAAAQEMAEHARREQVMQWAAKADLAACQQLEGSLTDASADIRNRAVTAIYWKCDRAAAGSRAATALCQSADLGTASAAVYLLLGYAPKETAEPCLKKVRKAWPAVKLVTASKPVPVTFAARIALARLGDETALQELRDAIRKSSVDEALFLLSALPDIEDAASLGAAIALLDDVRDCPGVRSGTNRKVRDAAADALVQRFRLTSAGYPLRVMGKRYTPAEIERIRAAASASPIKP